MPRDASLDEFVGGGESDVSEASEDEGDDGGAESGEEVSGEEVSAVEATYVWTPAGEACARCDGEAGRLWRCDGELVCGECKEW